MNRNIIHRHTVITVFLILLSPCALLRAADTTATTNAPEAVATHDATEKLAHDAPTFGRLTLGASFGDDLHVYSAGAMLPLIRSERTALYFNPRGVLLEDDEQELNFGLVLRRLPPEQNIILGFNAFYDVRFTDADNTLDQISGGIELLSRWVDARANYYIPVSGEKSFGGGLRSSTGVPFAYGGVEEALEGFDAEFGVWLPYLDRYLPTGLFVGYYRFESDVTHHNLDGMKARIEIRPCANITLDAAWFEDSSYRDSETVVGIRVHVPLDFWNGLKMERNGGRLPTFQTRMSEPVQRDYRVHTRITRATPPAAPASSPSSVKKSPPPYKPTCRTYPTLNEDGDVIFVTVCE